MTTKQDFEKFWDDAASMADKIGASLDGPECKNLVKDIYADFLNVRPKNKKQWLSGTLKAMFKCISNMPKWIGERTWPFFADEPMIFLHQFEIPISAQHIDFPLTDTVYVFGAKKHATDGSFSTVFRLVIQGDDGNQSLPKLSGEIEF